MRTLAVGSRTRRALAIASAAMLASGAVAGSAAALASASPARHLSPSWHGHRLPNRIYAPYLEAWTRDWLPAVAARSGARYFTLAFLQTAKRGSCTLTWNGYRAQTIAQGRYVKQIARLRAMGGDVIPSFGGYSADHAGTEIADSCASVQLIAQAYESVVRRYGVTRLDMDVEDNSLGDKAGIARRSEALALLERWAARTHRRVQIIFTLGVEPGGMPANCLAILKSAVAYGVRFRAVNIMAFDYYNTSGRRPSDMGAEALSALRATHRQLARLFPHARGRRLWAMEGITLLPGIDDFPKKTEVTYLSDADEVLDFASAVGLPLISIWTIERDNGRCPGVIDSNSCSGIRQQRWEFSHLLETYRSW
ncbi:MAG TPA: chitinase [Streptosporangiaceae bacterium]|nr:chitinase [Streptosporangiaceae bacterium]